MRVAVVVTQAAWVDDVLRIDSGRRFHMDRIAAWNAESGTRGRTLRCIAR